MSTYYLAGTGLFNEHGWWSLTSLIPPNLKSVIGPTLGKRSNSSNTGPEWTPPPKKVKSSSVGSAKSSRAAQKMVSPVDSPVSSAPGTVVPTLEHVTGPTPALLPLSEHQEQVLEQYLSQAHLAVRQDPKASRLLRKLKVRSKQRLYNQKVFDLDRTICHLLSATVKYSVDNNAPYYEQVVPVLRPASEAKCQPMTSQENTAILSRLASNTSPEAEALDHLSLIPVLSRALPPEFKTFRQTLCGAGDVTSLITSPYTTRKLKPFIFLTSELLPPKVQVNRAIVAGNLEAPTPPQTVDFCYLQQHHIPAVNNLVSHFFWPVDLSECLQYPDFTCVVLYGKMVIGCGFMTPDVKVNEAYISFLLVHPDFQHCSIGKIILYHLIQSCMGKDITLHVSVDNPAMLLYQTMGFKAESYCLDFYRHYYPEGHYLSKNAYFMRLRK